MRKNENVHALYNMLGYAEEPNICRRKLQLDYLGERDFNPKSCNQMCDNCQGGKKGSKVIYKDVTSEAQKVAELVAAMNHSNGNVTV